MMDQLASPAAIRDKNIRKEHSVVNPTVKLSSMTKKAGFKAKRAESMAVHMNRGSTLIVSKTNGLNLYNGV